MTIWLIWFYLACRALGLLEDDSRWAQTLEEASIFESSYKISKLFAIMLVFWQIGDSLKWWDKYRGNLSENVKKHMEREDINFELDLDIVLQ